MGFGFQDKGKEFKVLEGMLEAEDYFDFPFSALAFAYSLSSSELLIDSGVIFRKRNKNLTLIGYVCSAFYLREILDRRISQGFKIKSLNFVHKDFEGLKIKSYGYEYFVRNGYNEESVLISKSTKTRRRTEAKLRKCSKKYRIVEPKKSEVLKVFGLWAEGAKKRHFMVVKGHYLRYIENYFNNPRNTKIIGFRNEEGLVAVAGYEIFKNRAQITLMKNAPVDYNFPIYFWFETIKDIFASSEVEKVFCGSTADELKMFLGMEREKSFKVLI